MSISFKKSDWRFPLRAFLAFNLVGTADQMGLSKPEVFHFHLGVFVQWKDTINYKGKLRQIIEWFYLTREIDVKCTLRPTSSQDFHF